MDRKWGRWDIKVYRVVKFNKSVRNYKPLQTKNDSENDSKPIVLSY